MAKRIKSLTAWGLKVGTFADQHNLTLKDLAAEADVNYGALLEVRVGRTPGHEIVPKVDAYMEQCLANDGGGS